MAPEESVQLSVPLPVKEGTDWSGNLLSGNLVSQFSSVSQSCPPLYDPMACSPPGSSVHGISQARIRSGLPFPSPGDFPDPGMEPGSPEL